MTLKKLHTLILVARYKRKKSHSCQQSLDLTRLVETD